MHEIAMRHAMLAERQRQIRSIGVEHQAPPGRPMRAHVGESIVRVGERLVRFGERLAGARIPSPAPTG